MPSLISGMFSMYTISSRIRWTITGRSMVLKRRLKLSLLQSSLQLHGTSPNFHTNMRRLNCKKSLMTILSFSLWRVSAHSNLLTSQSTPKTNPVLTNQALLEVPNISEMDLTGTPMWTLLALSSRRSKILNSRCDISIVDLSAWISTITTTRPLSFSKQIVAVSSSRIIRDTRRQIPFQTTIEPLIKII